MNKNRKLSDLYFRFGKAHGLNWQSVADCLYRAELIEYVPNRTTPVFSHYRDTVKLMRALKSDDPGKTLNPLFSQYKTDQGLEDE